MADEILIALTGLLGGTLLTVATLAGAFLFRRVHELRDRIVSLETRLQVLRPVEEALAQFGAADMEHVFRNRIGGRRRAK